MLAEQSPNPHPSPSKITSGLTRDTTHYLEPIFFQVGDTLFQVPKHHFAQSESGIFQTIFSLKPPVGTPAEGSSQAIPFKIEGITEDEFRALLKVLYPLTIPANYSDVDLQEWMHVLKLSTMWDMSAVRKLAIAKMAADGKLTPVQMIKFGKEHHVPRWIKEGCIKMVNRHQGPSTEEGRYLGVDLTVRIYRIREDRLQWEQRPNGAVFGTEAAVVHAFEEELRFDPST